MRQGPVDIQLVNGKSRFEEISIAGVSYFVAVPEQDYQVKITLFNNAGVYPADQKLKVYLRIDGKWVGECQSFTPDQLTKPKSSTMFKGFRFDSNGMFIYCAFRFTDATFFDSNAKDNAHAGTIEVCLYSSAKKTATDMMQSFPARRMTSCLPESERGMSDVYPSASTMVGGELEKWKYLEAPYTTSEFEYGPDVHVYTATAHYHTRSTLDRLAGADSLLFSSVPANSSLSRGAKRKRAPSDVRESLFKVDRAPKKVTPSAITVIELD